MIGKCNTGGENVKVEVTAQTPLIAQILEGLVGKAQGANATADKILEGYSAYVGQELLEGTFEPITGIDFGEVTPASDVSTITINHNLGVAPRFAGIFKITTNTESDAVIAFAFKTPYTFRGVVEKSTSNSPAYYIGVGNAPTITDTEITFNQLGTYNYSSKNTYLWVAIA